jgi:hypothetical protein
VYGGAAVSGVVGVNALIFYISAAIFTCRRSRRGRDGSPQRFVRADLMRWLRAWLRRRTHDREIEREL